MPTTIHICQLLPIITMHVVTATHPIIIPFILFNYPWRGARCTNAHLQIPFLRKRQTHIAVRAQPPQCIKFEAAWCITARRCISMLTERKIECLSILIQDQAIFTAL